MGFFRKRVKIVPGLYLNLGKKGVSFTVGPRGASVNIRPKKKRPQFSNQLSYSAYMRASKEARAQYRALGGKVPAGVKLLKVCSWLLAIFGGLIILGVIMVKAKS